MFTTAAFAETAALVGDPGRAAMLMALMDGRALTASELARAAGITPQTASGHLARLTTAGLLSRQCQGRHHYHRLASPAVAHMLETIMEASVAGEAQRPPPSPGVTGPRDRGLGAARTCYDHLAGQLGVRLADALGERGYVELSDESGAVTPVGMEFFRSFGLDLGAGSAARLYCRPCLDWSERRLHIGGTLGAQLAGRCFALHWVRRSGESRAVAVTPAGQRGFREALGM